MMKRQELVFPDDNTKGIPRVPALTDGEKSEQRKEAVKDTVKQRQTAREKIGQLTSDTSRILFQCKAVFPFQLFPDEISVEANRVNLIQKSFFGTAEIKSVSIKDISEVIASTTPFLSSITIFSRMFIDNQVTVQYLYKKDAIKARRIVEGLKMLTAEAVDTSLLQNDEILQKAEEIGKINN